MTDRKVEEVIISKNTDPELAKQLAEDEAKKSTYGLIIGLICVVAGLGLIYAGVEGSIDWTLKGFGLESKLAKASPGIFVIAAGVIVILSTRFRYEVK